MILLFEAQCKYLIVCVDEFENYADKKEQIYARDIKETFNRRIVSRTGLTTSNVVKVK